MNGKTFVDTNVLIYAHDVDAKTKHAVAKDTLYELWTNRTGFLSTQVLQKFYVKVTRKLSNRSRRRLPELSWTGTPSGALTRRRRRSRLPFVSRTRPGSDFGMP
jgi:predicted nucleic acid-binding protein